MITAAGIVLFAGRNGLVVSHAIAKDALASVDRTGLETAEAKRYEAKAWDGKGEPPWDTRLRWLHGDDGTSRSAIEALEQPNGVVYFLFKDGVNISWQPHRPDCAGHIHMVDDPKHPDHWEVHAKAHVAKTVEREVDAQVLEAALTKALELHEERNVPYHASITKRP